MRTARLLLLMAVAATPVALLCLWWVANHEPRPVRVSDLAGTWRVVTVIVDGVPSDRKFDDLVFTETTAEYLSPAPARVDDFSVS